MISWMKIKGKIISDGRTWATPVLAKQEIAALATENNEHMVEPIRHPVDTVGPRPAPNQRSENRITGTSS